MEASEALNWGWMQWPVEEDSSLDRVESLEKVCSSVEQMGGLFSFLLLGYSQQECSTSSQADRPKLQDSPSASAFSCGLQVHACGCTWSAEVAHLAADSHVQVKVSWAQSQPCGLVHMPNTKEKCLLQADSLESHRHRSS